MVASRRLALPGVVALGGAIGTVGRYELAIANPVDAGAFPWPTFAVNVAGSLLLGAVLAWCLTVPRAPVLLRPFAAVGLCGGLTTFSTWMVADVLLVRGGDAGTAVLDLAATLVAGLVAVALGFVATRRLVGGRGPLVLDPNEAD